METLEEVDHTALSASDEEHPAQEDAAGEQTPERRHVDALLDISEEAFLKELEPHEYHCYSGWEDAVHGWARVAPLSCLLLTPKRCRKPKHREADNPTPLSIDPTVPGAHSSASIAEHRCESHVGALNGFKKTVPVNHQHPGSWNNTALQKDASKWPVEEKIEGGGTPRETLLQPHYLSSKYSMPENRPAKPPKHSPTPNSQVVPIKNFTFLPPIKSPHLNPQKVRGQVCSGKTAPGEGETTEENCCVFDKKCRTRGTRVDPVTSTELPTCSAALTSKYRTCQHNPHLFSVVSVSLPKRYQVPTSSKPDTVHRSSYSMGKSLTQALHSGTGARAHLRTSKTVCAVKLYEGCEINV